MCAASLANQGAKRELPSIIKCRSPIIPAKINALSHALASAIKASTTSSKR
ncbi:hypothetical protein E1A91_A08G241500v1 [Gossypium mustelinum]|uniref:Uncharacterized protein n=1 Tax=Gossypium mustelinum TaxID=34275 RepID=A0A5D2YGA0_GOSMU|nr:hypothetical protein E1A91_A08G241500v1 [Gossypium mustelinum]